MRIVFIGTGAIGLPALRTLLRSETHKLVGVVTQPDRPVGRAQRIQAPPIKQELLASRLPILQPERIRTEEAVPEIRALAPDLIVVMAYGQIVPKQLLEIPSIACLNLHASLLPRHRGAAPIQAAIVAGDAETGITAMYMDEGLDTGDILLQTKLAISPNETGGTLHDRLAQLAPIVLADAIDQLANGSAPRRQQNPMHATSAPKLTRAQGKIDWSEPAELIERKIRAYDPWPGAFTEVMNTTGERHKLKIFRAQLVEVDGKPESISPPNDEEVIVNTGCGALRLTEVQLEGKRRMSASEFLRGFSSPRFDF
jgi:methionyl-tRNA formyltransferase